jgi:hypothetical protein
MRPIRNNYFDYLVDLLITRTKDYPSGTNKDAISCGGLFSPAPLASLLENQNDIILVQYLFNVDVYF